MTHKYGLNLFLLDIKDQGGSCQTNMRKLIA